MSGEFNEPRSRAGQVFGLLLKKSIGVWANTRLRPLGFMNGIIADSYSYDHKIGRQLQSDSKFDNEIRFL